MANALTVDVEAWFQVYNLRRAVARSAWDTLPRRLTEVLPRLLDLLETHGARATFFVLGWIAEREPELVAALAQRGHEVASHGYDHRLLTDMEPADFRADLERTEAVLREVTGRRPVGYRAPSFTLGPRTLWALDVLWERGYRYDASLFPLRGRRYGHPHAPRRPAAARRGEGRVLWALPLLTRPGPWGPLPAAGGGYLRLLPAAWTAGAVRRMNRAGWPAVVYLHPWELDPDQPRLRGAPPLGAFLHRVGLGGTEGKLTALLRRFSFTTATDALTACLARHPELHGEPVPPALLSPPGSGTPGSSGSKRPRRR